MTWNHYLRLCAATILLVTAILYAFVLAIDPYDTVPFSLPLERALVAESRRYSAASIARGDRFDSVVLGTSTAMLIRPDHLNELFGAQFANLAMPSATPYEQLRLLELFARQRPHARVVMIGIDAAWCGTRALPQFIEPQSRAPFPAWMYDDARWNDLPPINLTTLTDTFRQFMHMAGFGGFATGPDGYYDFPRQHYGHYDPTRIKRKLRGAEGRRYVAIPAAVAVGGGDDPATWSFPGLEALEAALRALPTDTQKVLFLVPYHAQILPQRDTLPDQIWRACKQRLAKLAGGLPGAYVIDFMITSPLTRDDDNYWDPLHYTTKAAARLETMLSRAVNSPELSSGNYRVLAAPGYMPYTADR